MKSSDKALIFDELFKITCEFDRVCKENNLKYTLYSGSMIGAIRHNGFIPWDDDIDIAMLREDYNRLIDLAKNGVFNYPYFLQSPYSDEGSPRMFLRLRDSYTTSISNTDCFLRMNQGIFIDIFPLDVYPDSVIKRKILINKLSLISKISGGYARYYSKIGSRNDRLSIKILYYLLCPFYAMKIITSKKMFKLYNKVAAKYTNNKTNSFYDSAWIIFNSKYYYPFEWIAKGFRYHKFYKGEFLILKDYDKILTKIYGDYMTPKQVPTCHGDIIQVVDCGYEEFIKNNYELLLSKWKKG